MGFGFLPRVWLLERSFEIGVCMRLGFLGALFRFSSCSAQSCCEASNLIRLGASCGASLAACRSTRGLYLGRSWARQCGRLRSFPFASWVAPEN